jgi:hypothetical protein
VDAPSSVTPARRFPSVAIGAAAAVAGWVLFAAVRDVLPVWLRLLIAATALVFGPGAGLTCRLLRPLSLLRRVVLAFSFGVAFAPMVAHGLGTFGLLPIYPYLAAALAGGAVGYWREPECPREGSSQRLAALVLVLLTLGMGVTAFAHRLTTSAGETAVYGEYDSYDLTYYAAIAAELSHSIPPASPFYSGRLLNHAFYPHVLLALIHRFGDVPLLELYFRYAFPLFLTLAVLSCFVFVESIASAGTAFLAAVFFGIGSNFAFLAGWFLHVTVWDDVIWSHNLQGAGAEVLLYGDWAPALAAAFAGFFAIHNSCRESRLGWTLVAGAAFATTILSKPWVFAAVLSALAATMLTSRRDNATNRRLLLIAAASLVVGAPFLYRIVTLFDDSQVTFAPAFFPIPLVMAERVGLRDWFVGGAAALGLTGFMQTGAAGVLAAPLFLVGTLGFRLIGVPVLWKCLRHPTQHDAAWRVLAWSVVAALVTSTFIVSIPYHETTQVHQLALFLMAIFAAKGVTSWRNQRTRFATAVIAIALAIPSTLQYLHRKWNDREHLLVATSRGEETIASFLRSTDPERTVVLHDRPNDPTILGILSERRSVLAWSGYVRGSEARLRDVDAFFASPDAAEAMEILRRYHPSHVVEYAGRDHINPTVRDRLQFVLQAHDVTLYRVPESLRQLER